MSTEAVKIKPLPADILRRTYLQRRERNRTYSQNAFARDLGVSISVLSRVLSGERTMSLKFGIQAAAALGFSSGETNSLLHAIVQSLPKKAKISARMRQKLENDFNSQTATEGFSPIFTTVEIERFKAISQWYHLAILNLTLVDSFDSDPRWIAQALGISPQEARDGVDRLFALGLLHETDGKVKRTQNSLYIKTEKSETSMRAFHSQMIGLAKENLNDRSPEAFKNRLINSITFSCGPEHLEAIKDKIDQFQDEILSFVDTGTKKMFTK